MAGLKGTIWGLGLFVSFIPQLAARWGLNAVSVMSVQLGIAEWSGAMKNGR